MYTKLDLIDGFKNCVGDSSTGCFKKIFNASFKNHCMDSTSLLYGIQCSFESMLVLMVLFTLICKGTCGPIVVCPSSLLYCVASRQLVLPAGEGQECESQFLPYRSYERDQFGTNCEHLLNKTFFLITSWIFFNCSLEFDVYFIKHYNFVADDKGQPNVLINQW